MRLLNRFTRDEASAKIWWPLALLCVVAMVASVPLANQAADQAREDEAFRAAEISNELIEPLTSTGASIADLTATLTQVVASDPTLSAVRVWNTQHMLVASSDRSDDVGSGEALNDSDIDTAIANGTTWVVSDRLPTGDAGPVTFYAYSAIQGTSGDLATQFEATDATLLADVHRFWLAFRIVVGIATLVLLALAGLSMREPVARMGAEVPFYPESVPPWLSVMDVDRAVALEHAGDRAKDRLTGLQQRLDESERQRMKAEGELQQALAALSSGGRGMPVPSAAPASKPAGTPRQPTPEAAAAAVAAAAASAKAAKARRAKPAEPAPVAKAEPVIVPEPAMPEPPLTVGSEQTPEAESVSVIAEDVAVTASSAEPDRDGDTWPEVVVLPEPEPARHAVAAGSPDSDAAVLDVLNRLVEPVGDPEPAGGDAGDMRARLARTAALKKPGSRERREERERGEHERDEP